MSETLEGKTFTTEVADGHAEYEIVTESENLVEVQWIDNEYEYQDSLLGDRCVISKANVLKKIEWQERYRTVNQ